MNEGRFLYVFFLQKIAQTNPIYIYNFKLQLPPAQQQQQQPPHIYKKMGNKSSGHASMGTNPLTNAKLIQSQPGLQIYQTAQGDQYQKYIIPSQPNYQSTYTFRINSKHPQLVDIFYVGQPKSSFTCNTVPNIVVVSQRVPYRLSNLPPQMLQNAVTILRCTLLGFRDLFKVNGIMCVRDSMIGITARSRVKVWLNQNFAVNRPEPKPQNLLNLDEEMHEREMVQNIFDLINTKADPNSTWRQLTQARQNRQIRTFQAALILVEQFIGAHRLTLTEEVKNPFNKNLFNPNREDYNSQIDKLEELRNRSGFMDEGQGDRRVGGSSLQQLRRNLVGEGRGVEGEGATNVRQPFVEMERRSRANAGNVEGQVGSRPISYSPAPVAIRATSPSRPFQIKFNYQGQNQPVLVQARANPFHMIPAVDLAQQISRSSSEPKVVTTTFVSPIREERGEMGGISPVGQEKVRTSGEHRDEEKDDTLIQNLQEKKERDDEDQEQVIQVEGEVVVQAAGGQRSVERRAVHVDSVSLEDNEIHESPQKPQQPQRIKSMSEYSSPTFKLPSDKKDLSSPQEGRQFEVKVSHPEKQEQFVDVQPGTSLKQIVISQPYEEGQRQNFFGGAKQVQSIGGGTEGYQSNQSFSKYIDLFPQAKRAVSIKEGGPSPFKQKKQQIKKLEKIEELGSNINMTDSQELNSPVKQSKSPRGQVARTQRQNQNRGTEESLEIEGKKSSTGEVKKSGIIKGKKSGIMDVKKSGIYQSKSKISKVSYKDMRKMLLQTMQNN